MPTPSTLLLRSPLTSVACIGKLLLMAGLGASGAAAKTAKPLTAAPLAKAPALAQCKAYLSIMTPGPLGEEHRLSELRRLEAGFIKAFPKEEAMLEPAFGKLISGLTSDSRYHWHVEELALKLNHLNLHGKPLSPPTQHFWQSWQQYPSPSIRAPHAIDKNDECFESTNPSFTSFTKATLASINQYFGKVAFAQAPLAIISKVQLLAAGSYNPFGATASSLNGRPRVCINPEEAPPLLIPKLLHELTHASNVKLWPLRDRYLQAYGRWQEAAKQLEEKENALYNFDGDIVAKAQLEADVLMSSVSELPSPNLGKLKTLLAEKATAQPAYQGDADKAREQHALLLLAWTKQRRLTADLDREQLSHREPLDRARFFDEHRAYAAEYLAALTLLAAEPSFYCQLWVPSYPQKRPVRFYQAYEDVEQKIKTDQFSTWLAQLYIKSGKYLPSALYIDGNEEKGLQPALRHEGRRILRERLSSNVPVIPAPR